jgi:endosialidase-like protein
MASDFLAFAADAAANVMTQAAYADVGFTPRILGFQTGTALSVQLNKVWRQASLISAMIGQFGTTYGGADMLDDGSTNGQTALLNTFTQAVRQIVLNTSGTGYLPLAGGTLTGPLTIDASGNQLAINAPAGSGAEVMLGRPSGQVAYVQAQTGALLRWQLQLASADPETGGNTGSNFYITRFNDSGAFLDTPFQINRATGIVNFTRAPTVNGGNLPYLPLAGGTLSGPLVVGWSGISYSGTTGHWIAFGWDGFIQGWVDGTYVGEMATTGWVNSTVGNYLSIWGGTEYGYVDFQGGFISDGGAGFRSSVWFGNAGDFANFTGSGWRYRQWAGNWYDAWNGANGTRLWQTYGGASMQLDGGANLYVGGNIQCAAGHIHSNFAIGVTDYGSGTSQGMWAAGDGLWFGWADGAVNPTNGQQLFGNDGVFHNWNGIGTYNWCNIGQWCSVGSTLYVGNGAYITGHTVTTYSVPVVTCVQSGWTGMGMFMNAFIGGGLVFGQTDAYGNPASYVAFMNINGTFAAGSIYTWSGRDTKQNIEPSPPFDSLHAIRRMHSFRYDREDTHTEFGLIAEEVRDVLPDAVEDIGPVAAIGVMPLITHLCRAVSQLAALVEARPH